jgi:hypothetical protein
MEYDMWVEHYLSFLGREVVRLNAGMIGAHYLRCAEANYQEFRRSREARARFGVWLAIRSCCYWLQQIERKLS